MAYTYKNITAGINMGEDEYFKTHKDMMIKSSLKFIKNSHRDGHGENFINSEKDRLRKIIDCKNIYELAAIERNLLSSNIKTHLNSVCENKMKQNKNKRNVKARLIKKLLIKNKIRIINEL